MGPVKAIYAKISRGLDGLESGGAFRQLMALLLKLFAGGVALFSVIMSGVIVRHLLELMEFRQYRYRYRSYGSDEEIFSFLLFLMITIALGVTVTMTLYHRAQKISKLPAGSFTVLSITSILFRLSGEIMALLFLAIGLHSTPFMEPVGLQDEFDLFMKTMRDDFFGVALTLTFYFALSISTLVAHYFLAELTLMLSKLADDTSALRKISEERIQAEREQSLPPRQDGGVSDLDLLAGKASAL